MKGGFFGSKLLPKCTKRSVYESYFVTMETEGNSKVLNNISKAEKHK